MVRMVIPKKSLRMTVLMELTYVSAQTNFINDVPEYNNFTCNKDIQFRVLFQTLEQLIATKGPLIIFHVNDLFADYSSFAADALRGYALNQGYDQVIIESIPGDYIKFDKSASLLPYAKFAYDSVHLKNTEVSFYHYGMDGTTMLADQNSRAKAREKLQILANLCHDGLFFFPIDQENYFIPQAEYDEFIWRNKFYHLTDQWLPVEYNFPEGHRISFIHGSVYFINNNYTKSLSLPSPLPAVSTIPAA